MAESLKMYGAAFAAIATSSMDFIEDTLQIIILFVTAIYTVFKGVREVKETRAYLKRQRIEDLEGRFLPPKE